MSCFFANAQVGINTTTLHSETTLQSGSTSKVWKFPTVNSFSSVSIPQQGMIAFDDSKGGLVGYHRLGTGVAHWSELFLTEKIITPVSESKTLGSYYRNMSVYNNNTEYTISGLTQNIQVKYGGQEIIVNLDTEVAFNSICFRGSLGIRLINTTTNTLVSRAVRLFNYGGVTGVNSSIPLQIILNSVISTPGSYRVEIFHDPGNATACTGSGYFNNSKVSIIHH